MESLECVSKLFIDRWSGQLIATYGRRCRIIVCFEFRVLEADLSKVSSDDACVPQRQIITGSLLTLQFVNNLPDFAAFGQYGSTNCVVVIINDELLSVKFEFSKGC